MATSQGNGYGTQSIIERQLSVPAKSAAGEGGRI